MTESRNWSLPMNDWLLAAGAVFLILIIAVIIVLIITERKKKTEEFHSLKSELEKKQLKVRDVSGLKQNQDRPSGKQFNKRRAPGDDIKTRKLFTDQNTGLFSYHIELQDIQTGEKYVTGIADRIKIGRHRDCNLMIRSDTISGYHCEIRVMGGNLVLHDLQSLNGTFINGMRVSGDIRLPTGVILRLGQEEFIVTISDFRPRAED